MAQSLKLEKHVLIIGTIKCLTGLRIGGTKDDIDIGGLENPIIRHPVTREPYIPGSSLKGKLRSVLEYKLDRVGNNGEPCGCALSDCPICTLFGPHKNTRHGLGPTRLLVRDAKFIHETEADPTEVYVEPVEVKSENAIDRRTGVAGQGALRTMERVASGAKFAFEISMRVFEGDPEKVNLEFVRQGLDLIEKEYLGASGSRGYGKVEFRYAAPADWTPRA